MVTIKVSIVYFLKSEVLILRFLLKNKQEKNAKKIFF